MEKLIMWGFTTLIGAFTGSFLGAYLKEKGKNLATHEDLDKLVAQMTAVTQTTESIKAAISDDVWDRQKQWEMKRDALFEVVRTLGSLDDALLELFSAYNAALPEDDNRKQIFLENRVTRYTNWYEASIKFDAARFLAKLVCGRKVGNVLDECMNCIRAVSLKITQGEPANYSDSAIKRLTKIESVYASVRKELNLKLGE